MCTRRESLGGAYSFAACPSHWSFKGDYHFSPPGSGLRRSTAWKNARAAFLIVAILGLDFRSTQQPILVAHGVAVFLKTNLLGRPPACENSITDRLFSRISSKILNPVSFLITTTGMSTFLAEGRANIGDSEKCLPAALGKGGKGGS